MTTREVRTSQSHPIYVNWVQVDGVKGKIGLTLAPGKKQNVSITGCEWNRDVALDVKKLRELGTDVLVGLPTDAEFEQLQIMSLADEAKKNGIEFIRFPIIDGSFPPESDEKAFSELVQRLAAFVHDGRTVTVFCQGGLGRSGLVASSVLCALDPKRDAGKAIEAVRKGRPGAIGSFCQVNFVEYFAKTFLK